MLDDDAFGLGYRGRKSSVKEWTDPANGATMKTACAYAFDAVGRVSTIKQSNNGVAVPDIAFTYRQTGADGDRVKKTAVPGGGFCCLRK